MDVVSGLPTSPDGWISGHWGAGFAQQPSDCLPSKRKRSCAGGDGPHGNGHVQDHGGPKLCPIQGVVKKHRSCFIPIDGNRGVYYSERWEPNGSTLYFPVTGSLLANMDKYDQITFEQGCFFIGDESGGFRQKAQGQAIHCWRYGEQEKKLFISLSYFFSSFDVFQDVVSSLGGL
ncbi:uncharacterized protein [Paramormyrops kingsleyae]|uniref:uncharacterized protein n=1 Tax=Paramormyrops kingsleyae TaxID=1676925 RepID=UPI003B974014